MKLRTQATNEVQTLNLNSHGGDSSVHYTGSKGNNTIGRLESTQRRYKSKRGEETERHIPTNEQSIESLQYDDLINDQEQDQMQRVPTLSK
jgi:hypothetical protein